MPVAKIEGDVVFDSMRIVERLDALVPDPPLYPADPGGRARLDIFIGWFNFVWKGPPNAADAELTKPNPDAALVDELLARTRSWRSSSKRCSATARS